MRKRFFLFSRRKYTEVAPDEIMLDSSNLPQYDRHQFEGRLQKPISKLALYSVGIVLAVVLTVFAGQAWKLQIAKGQTYKDLSEKNMLRPVPIFAGRGVIYDRNGTLLVWNAPSDTLSVANNSLTMNFANVAAADTSATSTSEIVAHREYATSTGLAHVLGYVKYPSKDNNGFYYREDFEGIDGAEQYFNKDLQGENGSRLIEVDARSHILSESIVRPPVQGSNVNLSIDSRVQSALYNNIKDIAERVGFAGGAGVIMDVRTGEILALTSYPEYDPQIMSDGDDSGAIKATLNDSRLPFLDRAVDGLYTPGSIVKPYLALGALDLGIIDPQKTIDDTGSISIPNPYDSTKETVFRDWKALGVLDLRHAIAYSSDVYFYRLGGGYEDQKGLGIANIDKYLSMFGFGSAVPDPFVGGKSGTIPTPEWKKKTFNESWYLGDTYHTAIGQYGTQVTPVQVARAVAAVANNGHLLVPTIVKGAATQVERTIDIPQKDFDIVHEGMRLGVLQGTSVALNIPAVQVAGKSGTAELGASKDKVNSWITGYFPYDNPHYAFAVTLEKGSVHNLIGAAAAMRQQLDWMTANTPEYFR